MTESDAEPFLDCRFCKDNPSGCPRASPGSVRCSAAACKAAQKRERAAEQAVVAAGGTAEAGETTTCFKVKEVLGISMHMKLSAEERRRGAERSDEEIHYQLRGKFGQNKDEDLDDMIPDTRWVKLSELVENIDEAGLVLLDTFVASLKKDLKTARKRLRDSL